MVTHQVLTAQLGENAPTPRDPVGIVVAVDGNTVQYRTGFSDEVKTVDLSAVTWCCAHWDDNRMVSKETYAVEPVVLPEWLSIDEWLADTTTWKWTWGCGVNPTWPESWQRGLARLSTVRRIAAVKLLKTKTFRSPFRESIRNQIVAWLETPSEERTYDSPLSPRQWDMVIDRYVALDAKRTDAGLYRSKGHGDARLYA